VPCLAQGGELFDRITEKSTFTEKEASEIVKQVCRQGSAPPQSGEGLLTAPLWFQTVG
jgi:hypothetical protein